MTDLERFAAALLAQWRAERGEGGGPFGVDAMLDRILPYRIARRLLQLDSSEDYEALALRLIGGDEDLAVTTPAEAAEMARTTMARKIPDLDTLRLLRGASLALTDSAVSRLGDVAFGGARAEADAKWNRGEHESRNDSEADANDAPAPVVLTLPTAAVRDNVRVAPTDTPTGPPPAYLTAPVEFVPPSKSCWNCDEELPGSRPVKFCPFCGADQREPACSACATPIERHWKHCPECGIMLKAGG